MLTEAKSLQISKRNPFNGGESLIDQLNVLAAQHLDNTHISEWNYVELDSTPGAGYFYPTNIESANLLTHHQTYSVSPMATGILLTILGLRRIVSFANLHNLKCPDEKLLIDILMKNINRIDISDNDRIAIYQVLN